MTVIWYAAPAGRRLARLSPGARRRAAAATRATVRAALSGTDWRCERALRTVTDVSAYLVRAPGDRVGVLKVATTAGGMAGLRRERGVLDRLTADERLGRWRTVLPLPLAAGTAGPGAFLLTNRLPGTGGNDLAAADGLTAAAVEAISPLHRLTRNVRRVDGGLVHRWVDRPGERISRALRSGDDVGRVTRAVRAELRGRALTLGWVHGDLHPGNLLVGADGRVTGIIDWGGAGEQDLPILDLAFWLLAVDASTRHREFGERVAARLAAARCWTRSETALLDGVPYAGLAAGRTVLLLAWLRHVADNLANTDCAGNLPWLRSNVMVVLRQVARG